MDLTTKYMGLNLKNPIVPSASPLSKNLDSVKQLEDAGAAAIVCYSLFEEQITHEANELDHYLAHGTHSFAEALTYFPDVEDYNLGPEDYLRHITRMKESIHIPVIGSLNGVSTGGWIKYAKLIEQAGADGIELNVYYIPTDINLPGYEVENMYIDILKAVKESVNIPVAIKLSPYFSSFANMAKRLDEAGADAIVMFNRFYQPDFDLDNLEIVPHLLLSSSYEMRVPLRWIAILYRKIHASMAATSGIHSAEDVIKIMMAGGDAAMMCSDLLRHGPIRITEVLSDLMAWMQEKEYESISQMKGSMSQKSVAEPAAFERANYMKVLNSYKI
ncbi:MAG: dihydroorotate dehydrogenase-like protein [Ignavibacteria bacterium]|nr:dihydroorotate dehydrogenase-like protein [Ignavibacteria bacterium]